MNVVNLIGRITKDLEIRQTQSGISYVKFTLAVNRSYTPEGQEQQADFISCVAWRNQADNLYKFMGKGSLIAVEGKIETGSYDREDGTRVYTTEVVANRITFLESKPKQDDGYTRQDEDVFTDVQMEKSKTPNPF